MTTAINHHRAEEPTLPVESNANPIMKLPPHRIFLLIIFTSLTTAKTSSLARPGCRDTCGNFSIPYPFGIGPNCFLNKWYAVDCNSSKPYLSSLNNLPFLGVDLKDLMVVISVPMSSGCQTPVWNSTQNMNLVDTPFLFSKKHNKFIVEGCGVANISSNGNLLTGCSTICSNQSLGYKRAYCRGNNCCQTNIPYYLDGYSVNVTSSSNSCLSAFLVADNSYVNHDVLLGQSVVPGHDSWMPVVLRWTLGDGDWREAGCGRNKFTRHELKKGNDSSINTWQCKCLSELEEGNPYLSGGCKVPEECKKCMETWGVCALKESYDGVRTFFCDHSSHHGGSKSSSSRAIFFGVGMSILVLFLIAIGFLLYKVIQSAKDKRRKKSFFERNGGLLLKQQEAGNEGLVNKTKLFTSNELEKATDHFNENRIIGRGGQGTVYKGMLTDGRIVAVKKSKAVDQSQLELFINELVILSQVNHRNVVKLLGFCLETDVPILVSEFIPNGTLYEHIHALRVDDFISFNMRLQIAREVAGALSYLHSATSVPIYHRDIKSKNILLDEKYRAKISDFGTSRFVSIGQTHLTTLVQGTIGYLDPEYFQSSQFTEKSDVYSFGVVLVELLTGEKPICLSRVGGNRSLATHFIIAFEEERVMSVVDAKMVREGGRDVVMEIANLAMRCLNLWGKNRPTMKEVASELDTIRMSHVTPLVQSDFEKVKYNAGEQESLVLAYGGSTSNSIL